MVEWLQETKRVPPCKCGERFPLWSENQTLRAERDRYRKALELAILDEASAIAREALDG